MSNTTEALAALHAAEAELEAALAAEKVVAPSDEDFAPQPAAVVLTAEQIAAEKAAIQAYRDAGSPPPAPPEKPKWVELPNHLGPIPINGT